MNASLTKTVGAVCLCVSLLVAVYCPIHGHNGDTPDGFGYVSQGQSGTANVSGVNQQMAQVINWMPTEGPIVAEQLILNYKGHLMEIKGELQNG